MITTAPVSVDITPFTLNAPQTVLDDLRGRLLQTRWPDPKIVKDTSQGPKLAKIQRLVNYWATEYDWRRTEALLNGWGSTPLSSTGSSSISCTPAPLCPVPAHCC